MILLGLDFEATGLDIGTCRIVEVAAVLYSVSHKRAIETYSALVWEPEYMDSTKEAFSVHKIGRDILCGNSIHPLKVFPAISIMANRAEAIVAHNGLGYDKPLAECEWKRYNMAFPEKPWIDTRIDVPYPEGTVSRRLIHLAADHGIFYPKAHHALCDVDVMLDIVSRYDIGKILENAKSPTIEIIADVTFSGNQQAKDRRYRWDRDKKIWWKAIKEFDFEKEVKESPFKIRRK